jgi:hypothetical protein
MFRTIARCPVCSDGVVAVSDHLEIVFDPDSPKDAPCDHLCFFWFHPRAYASRFLGINVAAENLGKEARI